MALLSIEVLGPFQVFMAGKPVTAMESMKVRALTAYLAVESGRAHTRDALVGLLWPNFTEESARHNLRQALFNLRRSLGDPESSPPFLQVSRDKVQFNRESDYSLDLDRFNHLFLTCEDHLPQCVEDCAVHASNLEEMVKLYRGEFLTQLAVDDSTEFEDWLLAQRESLHQRVLEAHSYLANYYELHADYQNGRRHATRQLELDPWREEAYRQLMRLLALDGQRSAALAQYENCKKNLAEELDVEPSVETRQLYEQIRQGNLSAVPKQQSSLTPNPVNQVSIQLTPFVGRQAELDQLGAYLADPECRCVTLVGPGGIGKTRLALQGATTFGSRFAGSAAFVPLASVGHMSGVIPAMMSALNIAFYGQSDPKTSLLNYLRSKQMLVILDNVEHLLDDELQYADIISLMIEMLQVAPGVKLLVTSRQALNMQGEFIIDVQGLAYPDADEIDQPGTFDAVTLFVQRARRASPQFNFNTDNWISIAHICRLVEGMPLALELAATWMRLLSADEIASEIEHSLDFLSSSLRDLPERHRSMRVVFDHSWQMLSQEEQAVLGKLSVFRGGFQRQAAEQVAGATLTTLSTLVNRTLIRRITTGRYDQHELVRQYCADQLESDLEAKKATEQRHYAYFMAFVKASEQELRGAKQLEWLEKLEFEHDNLRRAFDWALANDRNSQNSDECALKLASALRWFWRMHGHFREGCDWLSEALQLSPARRTSARATALLGVSLLTNGLGDLSVAISPVEGAIEIFDELQDRPDLAEARLVQGLTFLWQGDANQGYARLEEALATYRSIGDRWGEAHALYRLGSHMADYSGNPVGKELLEESASILVELGEKYVKTSVLLALGIIELGRGEYEAAQKLLEQSLASARAIKHPWGIADALTNLGCLLRIRGDYPAAQSLFEEALDVYQKPARSIWQTDVYCAMAENAIVQGNLAAARLHLQAAISILGSSENKWLQVVVWYFRGLLAYYEGKYTDAAQVLEEDIPFERKGQYKPDLARSLVTLGRVKLQLGDVTQASTLVDEGLALFSEIRHKLGMVVALEARAEIYIAQGKPLQALKLNAASTGMRETLGAPLPPVERERFESIICTCQSLLGDRIYRETLEETLSSSFEEVVTEELNARMIG